MNWEVTRWRKSSLYNQAFKKLKLGQKAGMRVNKMLRDEMELQKLGSWGYRVDCRQA